MTVGELTPGKLKLARAILSGPPISCSVCGKFISYKDIEDGKTFYEHIPDTLYSTEENIHTHKACEER